MALRSAPAAPILSVIVPAWNEAEGIAACMQALHQHLGPLRPELIIVDDGSTDGTHRVAADWIARHPDVDARVISLPHRGKGVAVRAGVRRSRGNDVVYIDADMDIPASEIDRLLASRSRDGTDVVVGSKRALTWRQLPGPVSRRLISVTFSWLVSQLFHLPVRDTQTGVKLFPGPWLRSAVAEARVAGFLFDVELLAMAVRAGLRLREEPVRVTMRRAASRIGVRDCLRCVGELALLVRVLGDGPPVPVALGPEASAHGQAALGHGRG